MKKIFLSVFFGIFTFSAYAHSYGHNARMARVFFQIPGHDFCWNEPLLNKANRLAQALTPSDNGDAVWFKKNIECISHRDYNLKDQGIYLEVLLDPQNDSQLKQVNFYLSKYNHSVIEGVKIQFETFQIEGGQQNVQVYYEIPGHNNYGGKYYRLFETSKQFTALDSQQLYAQYNKVGEEISKFEYRPLSWSHLSLALKDKLGLLSENEYKKLNIHDDHSISLVVSFGVLVKTPTKAFNSFLLKNQIYESPRYQDMVWSR